MPSRKFECVQCGHRFAPADDAFTAACPSCGSASRLEHDDAAPVSAPEPQKSSGCLGVIALLAVLGLLA